MPTRPAIIKAMLETPWAILPAALSQIAERIRTPRAGPVVQLDGPHGGATRVGAVSIIPVYGVIEHRSDWMMEMFGDGTSIAGLREALAAELNDPAVKAVVLDIDSPGGTVAGMTELAAELRASRGGSKPIVAVADTLAASAAYWLACQCDEVVVTPSGSVGSIGVYSVHADISGMLAQDGIAVTLISAGEHKTEGNQFEPLSDSARADIQARVDASYQQFLADVASGRRVTAGKVEADFGGGRVLVAKAALAAGMVDRVATLAETVRRLDRASSGSRRGMAAEEPEVEIVAEDAALPPFHERLAEIVGHAQERARLRAKEGRPAFSTTTERALRSIRDSLDALLAPVDPAAPAEPVEPVAAVEPVKPVVPASPRFHSDDEWLAYLQETPA